MAVSKEKRAYSNMGSVFGGFLCEIVCEKLGAKEREAINTKLDVPIYVYAINPIKIESISKHTLNGAAHAIYNNDSRYMFPIGSLSDDYDADNLRQAAFKKASQIVNDDDVNKKPLVYSNPELAVEVVKILNSSGLTRCKQLLESIKQQAAALSAANEAVSAWLREEV
jgi:hypothetical protein